MLIALDSIADLGVSVKSRPSTPSSTPIGVRQLMQQEDLSTYSAIIGPLVPESIQEVAARCLRISMFPCWPPSSWTWIFPRKTSFIRILLKPAPQSHAQIHRGQVTDQKILVISVQKNQDAEAEILKIFPAAELVELREEEENVSLDREIFISQLSQEAENWVFVETDDFKIASSVSSI